MLTKPPSVTLEGQSTFSAFEEIDNIEYNLQIIQSCLLRTQIPRGPEHLPIPVVHLQSSTLPQSPHFAFILLFHAQFFRLQTSNNICYREHLEAEAKIFRAGRY